MARSRFAAFVLLWLSAVAVPRFAGARDLVVVWLEDGRMLTGEVDPRTDGEHLWLRSTSPTFEIATSAAWERIKAVNANGEKLAVAEFSKRIDEF